MGEEAQHFKPLLLLTQGQQTPHQHSCSLPAPLWNSRSLYLSCTLSSFYPPFACQALKFLLAFSTFGSPSPSLHLTPGAPSGPVLKELKAMVNKKVKPQILSVASRTHFGPFFFSCQNWTRIRWFSMILFSESSNFVSVSRWHLFLQNCPLPVPKTVINLLVLLQIQKYCSSFTNIISSRTIIATYTLHSRIKESGTCLAGV